MGAIVTHLGITARVAWYKKHAALLPSKRVAELNTPLVKSCRSTPVKLSVVPVFPPMRRIPG
jgi:hypothetical protein